MLSTKVPLSLSIPAGLTGVSNTIVGNAELRGISGGQKRRVTVGEKCFDQTSCYYFMDEPTSGLDANSALDICEGVKRVVNVMQGAVMMTLLQPSMGLYRLFDNILILTPGGRQAYFGMPKYPIGRCETL